MISKDLKQIWIGSRCKLWRIKHGYRLQDISRDTGYSVSNIAHFEHGRNNNMVILTWYITHGMTLYEGDHSDS
jgi:transcriptional regulator with XRE-family HTH domain